MQHWWLPRSGAGVRTMISDDVVWLAYATAHFIEVTGDRSILDKKIPFISGPALKEGEHDAFFTPEPTRETATLYEHCVRALDLGHRAVGPERPAADPRRRLERRHEWRRRSWARARASGWAGSC